MPFAVGDGLICHELHQAAGLVECQLQLLIFDFQQHKIIATIEEDGARLSHCAELKGETAEGQEERRIAIMKIDLDGTLERKPSWELHSPLTHSMRFLEHKGKGIIAQKADAILHSAFELIAAVPGDARADGVTCTILGALNDVNVVVKDLKKGGE